MTKVTKVDYKTFVKVCGFEINDEPYFEYYSISNEWFNGYFAAYENEFHKNHKYIYSKSNLKTDVNIKDIFQSIKTYFGKPLQVMVDSKEIEIISTLIEGGFKLKRRSFERCFKMNDIKKKYCLINDTKLINSISNFYEVVVKQAYNHYIETHKEINPLTVNIDKFRSILPREVYVQFIDEEIINHVFVEGNELCYTGSKDLSTFDNFIYTVSMEIFKNNEVITFETDDTDELAMKLKQLFNDNRIDSFDTYILS